MQRLALQRSDVRCRAQDTCEFRGVGPEIFFIIKNTGRNLGRDLLNGKDENLLQNMSEPCTTTRYVLSRGARLFPPGGVLKYYTSWLRYLEAAYREPDWMKYRLKVWMRSIGHPVHSLVRLYNHAIYPQNLPQTDNVAGLTLASNAVRPFRHLEGQPSEAERLQGLFGEVSPPYQHCFQDGLGYF